MIRGEAALRHAAQQRGHPLHRGLEALRWDLREHPLNRADLDDVTGGGAISVDVDPGFVVETLAPGEAELAHRGGVDDRGVGVAHAEEDRTVRGDVVEDAAGEAGRFEHVGIEAPPENPPLGDSLVPDGLGDGLAHLVERTIGELDPPAERQPHDDVRVAVRETRKDRRSRIAMDLGARADMLRERALRTYPDDLAIAHCERIGALLLVCSERSHTLRNDQQFCIVLGRHRLPLFCRNVPASAL